MRIFTKLVSLTFAVLLSAATGAVAGPIQPMAAAQSTRPPITTVTLTVYPNPSQGAVTVTLSEPQLGLDYKLRLRNIIGQEVRTFALRPELMRSAGLSLNLSDLPAGLYFYSLLVDNKAVLTKRLTLQ